MNILLDTIFSNEGIQLNWSWYRIEYQGRGAPHVHGCFRIQSCPDLIKCSNAVLNARIAKRMLKDRDCLQPQHDLDSYHCELDEWVTHDQTDFVMLSNLEIERLEHIIEDGILAHKVIVAVHDFLLTTIHPDPPDDACSTDRSENTVFNPETTQTPHPSSYDFLSLLDNETERNFLYSMSLSAQFRHKHQRYCDRNHSKRDLIQQQIEDGTADQNVTRPENIPVDCRFSYPKPLRTQSHVRIEQIKCQQNGIFRYKVSMVPKRNDVWLNSSMRTMTECWGANMDWQLILDSGLVIEYMTKYVTKSDFSTSYACNRFMRNLFTQTVEQEGRNVHCFLRKTMSKMLGERTMSKQEKCHLIIGSPIVHSSHRMINVDLDNKSSTINLPMDTDASTTSIVRKDTLIDAYAARFLPHKWFDQRQFDFLFEKNLLESMTLRHFCLNYYIGTRSNRRNKIIQGKGNIVVSFYPSPSCDPNSTSYYRYCKFALIKHKPWKELICDVYGGDDDNQQSIIQLWNTFISTLRPDQIPDSVQRDIEIADRRNREDNGTVYRNNDSEYMSPNAIPRPEEDLLALDNTSITDLLRDRQNDDTDCMDIEWDENQDWLNLSTTSLHDVERFKTLLDGFRGAESLRQRRSVLYDNLNSDQRVGHNMVLSACITPVNMSYSSDTSSIGKLQLLLGAGGCGKSFVIDSIITTLMNAHSWTEENFSVFATTGKAASNINGSTYQNFTDGLAMSPARRFSPLSARMLLRLQNKWKFKKLIFIDEFSMLQQKNLFYIDQRLKQIMRNEESFGGLVVILCGDPAQLPAVTGNCLWFPTPRNGSDDQRGFLLYQLFDTVTILRKNERIDGTDPDANTFESFLKRLRNGENTHEDWETLKNKCSQSSLSNWHEQFGGNDVIHLYCTNREVAERNIACLKEVGNPMVKVEAEYSGPQGYSAKSDIANGLDKVTYICVGAKVMITQNLWQQCGIVNGSTGIIIDIVYSPDTPPPGLPVCVLIDFGDEYTGPSFFVDENDKKGYVPIFSRYAEWSSVRNGDTVKNSRQMYPFRLCYAWTIWKSQGQTFFGKVVVSLGSTEREHGITYTAFSRVTKFSNLGILRGISKDRLCTKIKRLKKMGVRIREQERLCRLERNTSNSLISLNI